MPQPVTSPERIETARDEARRPWRALQTRLRGAIDRHLRTLGEAHTEPRRAG